MRKLLTTFGNGAAVLGATEEALAVVVGKAMAARIVRHRGTPSAVENG